MEVPPLSPHAAAAAADHPGRNHPNEVDTKPALAAHPGRALPQDGNIHNMPIAVDLPANAGRNPPDEANTNPALAAHPGRALPLDNHLDSSLERALGKRAGGGDQPPLELHPARYAPPGKDGFRGQASHGAVVDADTHERSPEFPVAVRSKV